MTSPTTLRPGVIGLGQIGGGVVQALHRSGFDPVVYDVFEQAVTALAGVSTPASSAAEVGELADVVLLAPAAASMDMFRDYAARGDAFAAAAQRVAGLGEPASDPGAPA